MAGHSVFELATNVRDPGVDVILLDTTFWGGVRACVRAAQICEAFGLGIDVHRRRGGKMTHRDGAIAVPTAPGLGVVLDRDRLGLYSDLYKSLGGYPYDRDPGRPGWYPLLPNTNFADHTVSATPSLHAP